MELDNRFRGSYTLVGDDVLAGIVAFGSAVPQEKLVQESLGMLDVFSKPRTVYRSANTYV